MTNRLSDQKSPYLLQHAQNPVDWYPWGPEAIQRARDEDRPMLVSIGYSSCHWCHVMAHESFEDAATASLMNELFVNIKVDREERPDIDAIYMDAVQALTQSGGWPLNVFVTPDGRPFYGGTYFPPEPRHGMPSWSQVLESISRAYRERRDDVVRSADTLTHYIRESQGREASGALATDLLSRALESISHQFDRHHGGFGGAPKFPQPLALQLILRCHRRFGDPDALDFLHLTLRSMSGGGIFDQIGGGFHRYTVDGSWVVPHYEKMLYDNALLAQTYTFAWQATHEPLYRSTAERTLEYLLRDMRSPDGGFYSAEDADSEGEEGKFYVWTTPELDSALGEDAPMAAMRFGIGEPGNFEGRTILTVSASIEDIATRFDMSEEEVGRRIDRASATMFRARERRVPPAKDTKIIASWNALAIGALAEAGQAFGRDDFVVAAETAADFVLRKMVTARGLVRTYNDGPSDVPAFLEDYAYMVEAFVSLYEATFSPERLRAATHLADELLERFGEPDSGLLFDSQAGGGLIVRPRGMFDNPIPSGNSSASMALLRLAALTGESAYERAAESILRTSADIMTRAPLAVPYLLCALDFNQSTPVQIAVVGRREPETRKMVHQVYSMYLPNRALAVGEPGETPLLENRVRLNGNPTAHVCEHFSCRLPVTDAEALKTQLAERITLEP